ncbi:MAG: glutamyl-tRNA reductase [Myxococcales bacterium]|nr:MAG: glutamyl-tRNA reductase [Myxococcales bacterium]
MMEIFVVGLSHHSAPLRVREKLSRGMSNEQEVLGELLRIPGMSEATLISTCNRVEIYGASEQSEQVVASVQQLLSDRSDEPLEPYLYKHLGRQGVRHVFRVTASLDSMVVGEPQILGQVKQAMLQGQQHGALSTVLGRCFETALSVAKKVRADTQIASGAVSVSSVACDLAAKIFGDLAARRVLLLGAGKMSEQAAKKLMAEGADLWVMNRSPERGQNLAKAIGGHFVSFDQMTEQLSEADVVITSTAAQQAIVTVDQMKPVQKARKHRPLFFIDIAVPRNVETEVGRLDGIYVYDLDDLKQVSEDNLKSRRKEAHAAEAMLDEYVEGFEQWRNSLELTPTIVALREQTQQTIEKELMRFVQSLDLVVKPDEKDIHRFAESMVNKVLHQPLTGLKEATKQSGSQQILALVRRLFALDRTEKESK